jgi:hypothetical protein
MSKHLDISEEMFTEDGDETELPPRISSRWRKPDAVRRMPRERESEGARARREPRPRPPRSRREPD